ncbi:hypothetical protein Plhal304r1_c009g0034961 [Plasmopara halstedii]
MTWARVGVTLTLALEHAGLLSHIHIIDDGHNFAVSLTSSVSNFPTIKKCT